MVADQVSDQETNEVGPGRLNSADMNNICRMQAKGSFALDLICPVELYPFNYYYLQGLQRLK